MHIIGLPIACDPHSNLPRIARNCTLGNGKAANLAFCLVKCLSQQCEPLLGSWLPLNSDNFCVKIIVVFFITLLLNAIILFPGPPPSLLPPRRCLGLRRRDCCPGC